MGDGVRPANVPPRILADRLPMNVYGEAAVYRSSKADTHARGIPRIELGT